MKKMPDNIVLRLRDPFLLDLSTYLSVAAMALLGVSGLSNLSLQLAALALGLTFALLYRFVFRTNYYERNPALYFGAQAVVMVMLFLLRSEASDAFNFLFYLLTIHVTVVLNIRHAAMWVALYFGISSFFAFINRGVDGLFSILFFLVVFIICAAMGRAIQQTELARDHNQQLIDELTATQQKLQELAVVEERNRLARDLHDSVKQQVFAISMQLSAARTALIETDKAYSSVIEAERLAQQASAELTTLIGALRPPALERNSLTNAIKEYVDEWSRQNNIETNLSLYSDLPLNVNEEQVFFRVIQESLSNIARHSQATQVGIELLYEDSHILFCIVDNGKGFDPEQVPSGVGLQSMHERLSQIGATFHLLSVKDSGTQITAKLRRS